MTTNNPLISFLLLYNQKTIDFLIAEKKMQTTTDANQSANSGKCVHGKCKKTVEEENNVKTAARPLTRVELLICFFGRLFYVR